MEDTSLFGFDPEKLKQMMAQFASTPEDQKAADKQAAFAFGFNALAHPYKGQELQSFANAGQNAMAARADSLAGAQQGKFKAVQTGMGMAKLNQEMQAMQMQQEQQRKMAELTQSASVPGMPPMGPPTPGGDMQPAIPPSFDKQKYGAGLWQIDPNKAMAFDSAQAKESPFDKINTKDFTQDSIRQFESTGRRSDLIPASGKEIGNVSPNDFTGPSVAKFKQTGNYGDLIPRGLSAAEEQRLNLERQRINQTERHWQADHAEIDPANLKETAKAIAAYQQPPLTSWAMAKPQGQALMGEVMRLNPAYSAQSYAASQQSLKAFATGKQGQAVNSFNVALAHLDTLQEAADAMKNGNIPLLNKINNAYKQQSGNPGPTNFEGIKQVVGNEIVKAIVGSGGGVDDRKQAADAIKAANSQAQLNGVIGKYKELMTGQLKGLQQQYEQTTQRKDFHTKLSPAAQKLVGAGQAQMDDFAAADRILSGGR